MKRRISTRLIVTVVAVAALVAPGLDLPARADEEQAISPADARGAVRNVEITIAVGDASGPAEGPERSYVMIAPGNGRRTSLSSGFRIPIATTTFNTGGKPGEESIPATSYSFQNVGFSAAISATLQPDGRISVEAEIEQSRLVGVEALRSGAPDPPTIATYRHKMTVVLKDGIPLRTTVLNDDVPRYLELNARVLD